MTAAPGRRGRHRTVRPPVVIIVEALVREIVQGEIRIDGEVGLRAVRGSPGGIRVVGRTTMSVWTVVASCETKCRRGT